MVGIEFIIIKLPFCFIYSAAVCQARSNFSIFIFFICKNSSLTALICFRVPVLNNSDKFIGIICQETPNLSFRSEEHTSELQSRFDLVCRLLLEKKKFIINV